MISVRRVAPGLLFAAAMCVGGCTFMPGPTVSFCSPSAQVRDEYRRMKADPIGLERPLVVLDGWRQFEWSAAALADELCTLTGADRALVMPISYPFHGGLDSIADEVVMRVERKWPGDDPEWTTEIDVVGHSMGGIVARLAALPPLDGNPRKRLRIRTLYTISSPHRGARMARHIALGAAARAMRPGSDTLARLDDALPDARYELVCYAQLNDWIVGARNAAPPGREPIWTGGTLLFSHTFSKFNRRILADIALRLRGEAPLARATVAPPRD